MIRTKGEIAPSMTQTRACLFLAGTGKPVGKPKYLGYFWGGRHLKKDTPETSSQPPSASETGGLELEGWSLNPNPNPVQLPRASYKPISWGGPAKKWWYRHFHYPLNPPTEGNLAKRHTHLVQQQNTNLRFGYPSHLPLNLERKGEP